MGWVRVKAKKENKGLVWLSKPGVWGCSGARHVLTALLWSQTWKKRIKWIITVVVERDSFSFIIPTPLTDATHTNIQSTPGFWQLLCVYPLIDEPYSKCFFIQISGSLSASCMLIPNKTLAGAVPLLTPSLLISSLIFPWLHMTPGHRGVDMEGGVEGRHH